MTKWKHQRSKPVIGLAGGIGAGKSTVARLFAREGCAVIDSDQLAHDALQSAAVKDELIKWLGAEVVGVDGLVDRKAVGRRVFTDAKQIGQLNALVHPAVDRRRGELMAIYLADPGLKAIVWDSPLLFETGLNRECDAMVFVKVPREMRLERLRVSRQWGEAEMDKREKFQFSLDKKAELADYYVDNSSDQAATLRLVQRVLSQLLAPQA